MALLRHPRTRQIPPPASGNGAPDEPSPALQGAAPGAGGSPWGGPLEAILRHPLLVILPALVLAGVGLAVGLLREPVHTAEARINVGRIDVPAYTLQGVTVGNITLAASYSRAVTAPAVVRGASRDTGISAEDVREQLSASPVPGSTLILVEAEADSAERAQQLANAGAGRLINYVTDLNVRQQESRSLNRFRRAQREVEKVRARLIRLARRPGANAAAIEKTRLNLRTAELAARSVGNRVFQASVVPPPENLLQLVVPAATSDSDETSVLQELGLIGLVAGLVVGIALALLRTNWQLLRRARRR